VVFRKALSFCGRLTAAALELPCYFYLICRGKVASSGMLCLFGCSWISYWMFLKWTL